ncbi:MAG: MMPL family transporter [Nitrospira sp. SB0677_bin_15]|nr:MMPL family transporter [Nitrospira sp. SB0667_bin_9]MYD31542.1 MMPL family transporter [Nitrospira sp. SB0661_bin_20]MYG39893.1 MMPL family transporter [Nitrospira sp. SB0677_bin_15]MYH02922.1 MMPL family transporter [Nitrospira sp. SB0675_bin_23]MYJ21868.1 MMPL family transporter [Nitrospira sp. SB0673_bin_12]
MTSLLLDHYTTFILRYRWLVIASATALMLLLTAGLQFITVSNNWRDNLDENNPQLLAFDALEDTYSATNAALIAVAPKGGSIFTREALSAIEELTEAAWRVPWSTRVDSLTNYYHSESVEDDLNVERLVDDAGSLSDDDLARIKGIALGEISIAGRLVSYDGRVAGVAISFALPDGNSNAAVDEITDYVRNLLNETRAEHPDIGYHMTGDVFVNHVMTEAVDDDMRILAPAAFLVILSVAAILLRSLLATLSLVVMLIFVIGSTMGVIGWAGLVLNAANSGVPIIIMTMAIADSVHIIETIMSGMRRGLDRHAAIVESLRDNAWPVFLTTVTTMIGFLSLNASDSPPFRVLGNLVAFGMFSAFVYSMTLLPALLTVLPLRARPGRTGRSTFFDRFGAFVVARRTLLFWSMAAVAVTLVTGIPRIELTDNWLQYLDERYEFRRDTDFVVENLTGMENLEYSLNAGREGGITDPDYLHKVDAFAEWYRAQPEVAHVQAFSDIMKRLNKNMHGDDPAFYRLPEDSELAAQYLLLYELSVPFGSDLNNRINIDKSATRMTVTMLRLHAEEQRKLDVRGQEWLRANAPDLATEATGISLLFAHLNIRNTKSMLGGTVTAMALISFLLIGIFRSVRLGLLSLVPNFIPATMAFGVWGYLYGEVGNAGSLVTAIAFGTVVDDTIHFMTKYLKARRESRSASEGVQYAFRSVGRALFTTTMTLVLGFMVFASSGFVISWMLGLLVALTIGFALICDFLLLPPLLIAIDRKTP